MKGYGKACEALRAPRGPLTRLRIPANSADNDRITGGTGRRRRGVEGAVIKLGAPAQLGSADRIAVAWRPWRPVALPVPRPGPPTLRDAETSGMLTPAPGDPYWGVKGPPQASLGTLVPLVPASPAVPPPKAHLTAAPVRRNRWMALSAAVIAASARQLSIAAAREACRHPRRDLRGRTQGSGGSQHGGTRGQSPSSSGEGTQKDGLPEETEVVLAGGLESTDHRLVFPFPP